MIILDKLHVFVVGLNALINNWLSVTNIQNSSGIILEEIILKEKWPNTLLWKWFTNDPIHYTSDRQLWCKFFTYVHLRQVKRFKTATSSSLLDQTRIEENKTIHQKTSVCTLNQVGKLVSIFGTNLIKPRRHSRTGFSQELCTSAWIQEKVEEPGRSECRWTKDVRKWCSKSRRGFAHSERDAWNTHVHDFDRLKLSKQNPCSYSFSTSTALLRCLVPPSGSVSEAWSSALE